MVCNMMIFLVYVYTHSKVINVVKKVSIVIVSLIIVPKMYSVIKIPVPNTILLTILFLLYIKTQVFKGWRNGAVGKGICHKA